MTHLAKLLTVCLLTGSTSLVTLPACAQIAVTGGRLTGDAAFFRPVTGNTVFFDLGTRTLRLDTPNGVTVDSRFLPTSAQLEAIGNRLPATGDRGILDGLLSGRAFDLSGSPVFFSNIATRLNFSINGFAPSLGNLGGTLIESSNSSKVFVPVFGVQLDPLIAPFFSTTEGVLAVGAFDARLSGGVIALPNTTRFGTPLVSEFAVPDAVTLRQRNFSFQLQGIGIPNSPGTAGDPLGSFFDPFFAGGIRFSSTNAVTSFTIQLDGTSLNITGSGTFATIIEIQGITPASSARSLLLPGNNPFDPRVGYSVIGNGSGSVTNSDPLRFSSGLSATVFNFQDNFGNFATGVSAGATSFVIAGAAPFTVSSFSNLIPTPAINAVKLDATGIFIAAPVVPPPSLIGTAQNTTSSPVSGGQGNSNIPLATVLDNLILPTVVVSTTPTVMNQPEFFPGTNIVNPGLILPSSNVAAGFTPTQIPGLDVLPITQSGAIDISAINPAAGQATSFINAVMSPLSSGGVINSGSLQEIQAFTQQQNRQNAAIGGLVNADVAWTNTMTDIRKRDARIQTENEERAAINQAWRAENGLN